MLLRSSFRLHPGICSWVSDAFYGGHLKHAPENAAFRIAVPYGAALVKQEAGILYDPIPHARNTQGSEEEAQRVRDLVQALVGRDFTGKDSTRPLILNDILIVAPDNMQVQRIAELVPGARVGSVDRFQGQEAPVVIVSMCASSLDEVPRGAGFLFSPNRLNVAVSRAQALAIVVAAPRLLCVRCQTVEEMTLMNRHCWLVEYARATSG